MNLLAFHQKLLKAFQEFSVQYLIVGGYAVGIYGYIRATVDLDIWIDKEQNNLQRIINAFISIGYDESDSNNAMNAIHSNKNVSLYDSENNKIDIIQLYSNELSFAEAYSRKYEFTMDDFRIQVIGYDDLIDTKIKAGRGKDWEDVRQLQAIDELKRKKGKK